MISWSIHLTRGWGIGISSLTALMLLAKILLVLVVTLKPIKTLMFLLMLTLTLAVSDRAADTY